MSRKNARYSEPVAVPQEPVLPHVEIKRLTLNRYRVRLHLVAGHPLQHYRSRYSYETSRYLEGEFFGRERAQRKARAMLAKYMRQIGYRTEDVVRYVGREVK